MLLLALILVVTGVLAAGAAYQWHLRRHLPHDLRPGEVEGLPSDASIRSGELGLGAASLNQRGLGGGW